MGGAFGVELLQELLLPGRQVDRRLDHRLDEHVAPRAGAQDRHALVLEPELVPRRHALTDAAYFSQLNTLLEIETTMSNISSCRKIVALDAPTEALIGRLRKRDYSFSPYL